MRFQVPQFIETEEQVIGPLTLKQFFWIGGGGVIIFILFVTSNLLVVLLAGIPIVIIFSLLAFYKIQNIPLYTYLYYGIKYFISQKKYFYKNPENKNKNFKF